MSDADRGNQSTQRFSQTVERVKSELDRIVEMAWAKGEEAIQQFRNFDPESDWIPEIDIVETEESLVLFVNLPGVPAENVNISLAGNSLEITAQYESLTLQTSVKVHKRERPSGRVHRIIALPLAVDNESAVAHAESGVFKIELKKASNLRPRQVPVTVLDECDSSGKTDEKSPESEAG